MDYGLGIGPLMVKHSDFTNIVLHMDQTWPVHFVFSPVIKLSLKEHRLLSISNGIGDLV